MKIIFLTCLAIGLFAYGYYLGVESSIKQETSSIILESELLKGNKKCLENTDIECMENIQNMMAMYKKARVEYLLKNDLKIQLGQSIEDYNEWLGEQIASNN
jgi:hypothetical protein